MAACCAPAVRAGLAAACTSQTLSPTAVALSCPTGWLLPDRPAQPLAPGEVALRIPERLIVTLDQVFQDNTLAELVTTGKLSGGCCACRWVLRLPAPHLKAPVRQHTCLRRQPRARLAWRLALPGLLQCAGGRCCAGCCHEVLQRGRAAFRAPRRTPCMCGIPTELACLTLYLAYEKKRGKERCGPAAQQASQRAQRGALAQWHLRAPAPAAASLPAASICFSAVQQSAALLHRAALTALPCCSCWYAFIKELDRMQGRGSQVRGLAPPARRCLGVLAGACHSRSRAGGAFAIWGAARCRPSPPLPCFCDCQPDWVEPAALGVLRAEQEAQLALLRTRGKAAVPRPARRPRRAPSRRCSGARVRRRSCWQGRPWWRRLRRGWRASKRSMRNSMLCGSLPAGGLLNSGAIGGVSADLCVTSVLVGLGGGGGACSRRPHAMLGALCMRRRQ